mmetsp:Transcript_31061/g.58152  ORF Transcript_31061/g.58152 Transcript_31061/m.58152 type:complete len:224 (+) Transcript_31061:1312-1983(+)
MNHRECYCPISIIIQFQIQTPSDECFDNSLIRKLNGTSAYSIPIQNFCHRLGNIHLIHAHVSILELPHVVIHRGLFVISFLWNHKMFEQLIHSNTSHQTADTKWALQNLIFWRLRKMRSHDESLEEDRSCLRLQLHCLGEGIELRRLCSGDLPRNRDHRLCSQRHGLVQGFDGEVIVKLTPQFCIPRIACSIYHSIGVGNLLSFCYHCCRNEIRRQALVGCNV